MSKKIEQLDKIKGFGKDVNDYLNHYITVSDAKSGAVIATNLVMLGVILELDFSKINNCFLNLITYSAIILSLTSIIISLKAIYPRLPYNKKKGLIFWESIRNYENMEEYLKDYKKITEEEKELLYAKQNYFVSSVLKDKNCNVRYSITYLAISIILTIILLIIIKNK